MSLANVIKAFGCVPDIDMIPQRNMQSQLETFLQAEEVSNINRKKGDTMLAYVIPTYEIDSNSSQGIPSNKKELMGFLEVY